MSPTGRGGTAEDRLGLLVVEEDEDGEEEKKAPLKSALVLGAEATRRRNRLAEDPPEEGGTLVARPGLVEPSECAGDGVTRNELCVGLAVCGSVGVLP